MEETLSSPDETVPGYGGRLVAQRVYVVNRKRMMLRVVYERVCGVRILVPGGGLGGSHARPSSPMTPSICFM